MANTRPTVHDLSLISIKHQAVAGELSTELVEALRSHRPEAFVMLVQRYESRLLRSALAITRNREDAEDAVQTTFLQVHRHIDGFRGESQFSSWLTRILINQSLSVLRGRSTLNVSIDDSIGYDLVRRELEAPCDTPEGSFLKQELTELLLGVLKSLPAPCQQVAQLHYLNELSYEEIATTVGISLSAAKSRMFRARKALRRNGRAHLELRSAF